MKSIITFLKATIVGGVLFLVPVIVIALILGKALQIAVKIAQPMADYIPVNTVVGIAVANFIAGAVIVVVCFAAGLAARSAFARGVVEAAENRFLWRMPGYGFVKGVTDSFGPEDRDMAMRPVIARFDDSSQIAFEVERLPDDAVVVFIPGTPDPWSGDVVIMGPDRIEALPITTLVAVQILRRQGKGTGEALGTGSVRLLSQH